MTAVQTWARIAGVLFLLSILGGAFGEFYVPSKLVVSADAAATAKNIRASEWLFRAGFAAFFGLISTALFGVAELFYFAALLLLGGADYLKTFSPDQLNTLGEWRRRHRTP
jgi:hypothetical protein